MKTIKVQGESKEEVVPLFVDEDNWGNPLTAEQRDALEAKADLATHGD